MQELKSRIDKMVGKHRDDCLEAILTHFSRLAVVIGVMAGSGALVRYREVVLPEAPSFAGFMGLSLLLVSFGLLAWVAFSGWYKLVEMSSYSWSKHSAGALIMVLSILFVVAGVHAAFSN
ncbi:MAG: hypothetical protein JXQ97_16700 [Natronospirillum sp.]